MAISQARKKIFIGAALVVAIALISVVGVVFIQNKSKTSPDDTKNSSRSNHTKADSETSKQSVNPEYINPSAEQTGAGAIKTGDESAAAGAFPTTQPNLAVRIISISQSSEGLIVRNEVSPRASDGQCTIRLSRGSQILAEQKSALTGSSCSNSSVQLSSIATGELVVTIQVQVGSNVANSTQNYTYK